MKPSELIRAGAERHLHEFAKMVEPLSYSKHVEHYRLRAAVDAIVDHLDQLSAVTEVVVPAGALTGPDRNDGLSPGAPPPFDECAALRRRIRELEAQLANERSGYELALKGKASAEHYARGLERKLAAVVSVMSKTVKEYCEEETAV